MSILKSPKLYTIGVIWFVLHLLISSLNDVATKYLGERLHPAQVVWFRFVFGTLTLLPFMLLNGKKSFYTSNILIHVIRGILLFFAIGLWCYGINFVPITTATVAAFTVPFFTLIMAPIFLSEKVGWKLWAATLIGFCGVAIVFTPQGSDFQLPALLMIVSAFSFAVLDVINKKFIVKESFLAMLFYSALVTSILGFYPALQFWQDPTSKELLVY